MCEQGRCSFQLKGEPTVVWLSACAPQDTGTGRCRLSRALLRKLQLRPGDGVAIEVRDSDRVFLCSASLLSHGGESDELVSGDDFGAIGENGARQIAEVQVDGCVELPLDLLPPSLRTSWSASNAVDLDAVRTPTGALGLGAVHAFKHSAVPASSVRLCCAGFEGDPEAALRVAFADALTRHLLCRDARLAIPEVGTLLVEETQPSNCPVMVLGRTRVSFSSAGEAASTRGTGKAPDLEQPSGSKEEGQRSSRNEVHLLSAAETEGAGSGREGQTIDGSIVADGPAPSNSNEPSTLPVWMPPERRPRSAISFSASPSPSPSTGEGAVSRREGQTVDGSIVTGGPAPSNANEPSTPPAWMPPARRPRSAISFSASPSPSPSTAPPSSGPAPHTIYTSPSHSPPPSTAHSLSHTASHITQSPAHLQNTHPTPSPSASPSPSNSSPAHAPARSLLAPSPSSSGPPRHSFRHDPRDLVPALPFSIFSSVLTARSRRVQTVQGIKMAETVFCGSKVALEALRDAMWVVLREQSKMTSVGVGASKGMLLNGPPGSGKSFLVHALAAEFDVVVLSLHPDDIYQGGPGDGEERLRQVFRSANKAAPCIVLLKDIDVMCPVRQLGRDAQARVVAQLLSLMDGGRQGNSSVMVVGTCCKPNFIDAAMRRPGRLDREVSLNPPSMSERKDMLDMFLSQMQCRRPQRPVLAADVSLDMVARKSVGFVGASLKALCAHAAGASILREGSCTQECRSRSNGEEEQVGGRGGEVLIRNVDFEKALEQVRYRAGGTFEVLTSHGGGLDEEVGGLEQVKKVLRQAIEWPLLYSQRLKAMGVRPSRGVLLYGAPGCGKTSLVRAAAGISGIGFLKANGAELFSAFLGESERILRDLFSRARTLEPCVLFLDEIDAIVGRRSLDGGGDGAEAGGVQQRVLSTLLNELDGVESAGGVILVGATNRLDMIDPALLRPGRFDHLVHVPLPDAHGRYDIMLKCTRHMSLSADVDLERVSQATANFTGAELTRVCKEAALAALREDVTLTSTSARHFEQALDNVTPAMAGCLTAR